MVCGFGKGAQLLGAGSFMGAGAKLDAGLRGKGWETQFGVRGEIQESEIRIFTKTVDVMDAT